MNVQLVLAGSATWNLNADGYWYNATNWTPATEPNGPADTATFDVSNALDVFVNFYDVEVNGIVFNAGASPFTISVDSYASYPELLTISGVGITNNSGKIQNFVTLSTEYDGMIQFTNSATAGKLTVYSNNDGGDTQFFDTSSADNGTFTNSNFGATTFFDNATAGNATLIAKSGDGGFISFQDDSIGGTARVEAFGSASLDISGHNAPGVTIGSLEGDGVALVGANNLTIGSNNLSTTFSGVIQDAAAAGGQAILRSAELYDSGAASWTPTGSLCTARTGHTATLLLNGKVLVAGGSGADSLLTSAELYEPATNTWTPTGNLITARTGQTATLLPDGRILVAGGDGGGFPLASAELYDPASGSWSATGEMTTARYWHTATLLPNGKVLVVGYFFNAGAELYDPATGRWTKAASPIASSRVLFTATLLTNGKVLVAGGQSGSGFLASAELYDPVSDSWATTARLSSTRSAHTATLLPSGMVLVAGGFGLSGVLLSAELYDPARGIWSATDSITTGRYYVPAALLPDGKVLLAGGYNYPPGWLSSAELYDPASGTWAATGSLLSGRYGHTSTLLTDGRVLSGGGVGPTQEIGSLTKIGTGTLTLASGNSYNGGTTVSRGILLVSNIDGSGTGAGAVSVNAGTLGGSGIIAGAVTVGTTTGVQAFLAPSKGAKNPAALTIQSLLTLNDDSTYIYKLDTRRSVSDEVIVSGVVIDSGARFSFRPSGNNALTVGQVFMVINNTSASPIIGTFHNLRDGQIITVNNSNLQASYNGGDGNDLTLTVQ